MGSDGIPWALMPVQRGKVEGVMEGQPGETQENRDLNGDVLSGLNMTAEQLSYMTVSYPFLCNENIVLKCLFKANSL